MINEKQARKYCGEDISAIENYEQAVADQTQTWHCHHRLEIQGPFRNSKELLKKCGMYYKVPASQLVFMKPYEHLAMHGTLITDGTRQKRSKASKRKIWSNESREKLRKSLTGRKLSEEHKLKIGEALKGHIPWNKGKTKVNR